MVDLVAQFGGRAHFYRFPSVGPYTVTSNNDPQIDDLARDFSLFIYSKGEEGRMATLISKLNTLGKDYWLLLYKKQDQINDPANGDHPDGQLVEVDTECDTDLVPLRNSIFWFVCDIVDLRDNHPEEVVNYGEGHPKEGQPVLSIFGSNRFRHVKQESAWYQNITKDRLEEYWETYPEVWNAARNIGTFDDNAGDVFRAVGEGTVKTDYYDEPDSDAYINHTCARMTWEKANILAAQNGGYFGANVQGDFSSGWQAILKAMVGDDGKAVQMQEFSLFNANGTYKSVSEIREDLLQTQYICSLGALCIYVMQINSAAAYAGNSTELAKLKFGYIGMLLAGYGPLMYPRVGADYSGAYIFQIEDDIKRLGSPTGIMEEVEPGVWERPYQNGLVWLDANALEADIVYTTLPAPNVLQPPRIADIITTFIGEVGEFTRIPLFFDDPNGGECAVTLEGLPPGVSYGDDEQAIIGYLTTPDQVVWNPVITVKNNAGVAPYKEITSSFRLEVYGSGGSVNVPGKITLHARSAKVRI